MLLQTGPALWCRRRARSTTHIISSTVTVVADSVVTRCLTFVPVRRRRVSSFTSDDVQMPPTPTTEVCCWTSGGNKMRKKKSGWNCRKNRHDQSDRQHNSVNACSIFKSPVKLPVGFAISIFYLRIFCISVFCPCIFFCNFTAVFCQCRCQIVPVFCSLPPKHPNCGEGTGHRACKALKRLGISPRVRI